MNRVSRVNQLIKEELSRIVLLEVDFPEGVLVTLTRADVSANLIEAKVYVSVLPEDRAGQVLKTLSSKIYSMQQQLNKRLNMRPIPKIRFVEERNTAEAGKIEELLEEIHRDKLT
jgi:ribosome-binding factor A